MDFSLNQEQTLLRDSAERFVQDRGNFAAWRRLVAAGAGFDRDAWRQITGLGWLGIAVGEDAGGLGGSPVETMLVMEALGRCLCRLPYVGTAVIGPAILADGRHDALLAKVAEGGAIVALAIGEPAARFSLAHVATNAKRVADGWAVDGSKGFAPDGAEADWFIVPARTSGAVRSEAGISLFLVPRDAAGLRLETYRGVDFHHHARLVLDGVALDATSLLGAMDAGYAALEAAVDRGIVAHLAEAVGCMEALQAMTLEYLKTREQFGATLGSFQALQHRIVDMTMACEEARSMLYFATLQLDAPTADRRRAVSAAKTRVGQTAAFVGHQAVQLHGGVGTSDELAVSHHLKRLMSLEAMFGNADHHRSRFAALTAA